jgi:4-amino-4-deoxy-L-arabinose transferase-like glycosyltransferase
MASTDAPDEGSLSQPSRVRHFSVILFLLLVVTVGYRSLGITRPLIGNFSTKSVIYGMIARNWAEGRAGMFYPTMDVLVGGERSLHMLEFSVSAQLTGALWKWFGGALDVWGRATSIAFLAASVLLLVTMVRRRHGDAAALGAGAMLALSPISVAYGQTFMLDASIVFFTVAVFYCADRWLAGGSFLWLVPLTVCYALLLLTKVYLVVLLLPMAAMVLWPSTFGPVEAEPRQPLPKRLWIALVPVVVAVIPVTLWCIHAIRTAAPGSPYADHIYSCLQGNASSYRPPDPLLFTGDFYRQALDDLTTVILTPIGFGLFLIGFLNRNRQALDDLPTVILTPIGFAPLLVEFQNRILAELLNRNWFRYLPWLVAMVLLVLALPRKFHEMNYYYMAVLPPLCIMVGLGWQVVWERIRPGRVAVAALLAVALLFSLRYAAKPAYYTPAEDRAVVAASQAIQELTEPEEPVATMHGTSITLLYYCNRPGWYIESDTPELDATLEGCRRQGARYFVVAGPEGEDDRMDGPVGHEPIKAGDGYRIYELAER